MPRCPRWIEPARERLTFACGDGWRPSRCSSDCSNDASTAKTDAIISPALHGGRARELRGARSLGPTRQRHQPVAPGRRAIHRVSPSLPTGTSLPRDVLGAMDRLLDGRRAPRPRRSGEFDPKGSPIPPQTAYVGRCAFEPPAQCAGLREWIEATRTRDRPIAFAHLGRTFSKASPALTLANRCEDAGLGLVLATDRTDAAGIRLPPRVFVAEQNLLHRDPCPTAPR